MALASIVGRSGTLSENTGTREIGNGESPASPFASGNPSRMGITLPDDGRSGTANHGRSGTKTREIRNTQHTVLTWILPIYSA